MSNELCKCGKVGKISCPNDERCMTNNPNTPQLPVEVVERINADAEAYATLQWGDMAKFPPHDVQHVRWEHAVDDYIAGATVESERAQEEFKRIQQSAIHYANRKDEVEKERNKAEKERDELRQWKMEAVELQVPIIAYCHKHLDVKIGDSCTALVMTELDRLRVENEKLKAMSTGWRPLLEEVLRLDGQDIAYISEELIEKIKTFLYGE